MIQGQPFHDVSVSYDGLGRTMVSWKLDPRFDDPFPHVFSLEFARSQSGFDTGEFQVLDEGDRVPFLTDRVFRDASIASQAYYRVRLKTPAGEYVSRNKGLEGNIPGVNTGLLKELIRKENLVLRKERGGVQGYLFKRRYYGPTCKCTDKNTGILVSSACLKCAGTGYVDGYFPGVPFPVLIENQETRHAQITQIGTADVRELVVRCLANPVAESKDIWMEADTSRVYEVREYSVVGRMAYYPVAAKLQMRELPLTDTISLIISSTRDPDISVDVVKPEPLPGPTGLTIIPPQIPFDLGDVPGPGQGASGPAGGDLSGTYPEPVVVGLRGRAISPISPLENSVLTWTGAAWTPALPTVGTVTSIDSGLGLLGGPITASGTLSVNFASSGASSPTQAVRADDSRLSDARTPTAHKLTHAIGGSDPLSPADIGASAVGHVHAAADVTSGIFALARIPTGTTSSTVALGDHGHGNITNAGAIGSLSGLPLITGSGGVVQVGSFGTVAGTFCAGDDGRLSNSRPPSGSAGGDLEDSYPNPTVAGILGNPIDDSLIGQDRILVYRESLPAGPRWEFTALPVGTLTSITAGTGLTGGTITGSGTIAADFGSTAGTICQGDDSRLSDARTPTAHKLTHAIGGSDPLSPADIGAAPTSHTHAASDVISGTFDIARIPLGTTSSTVCVGNDARLSNARTPTAHAFSHSTLGSDAISPASIGAATASHTHGNITNGGAIGSTSGLPIRTGNAGLLEVGSFGTTAGTFCAGDDARLALQTITLTGDVTGSGTGSFAATIANDAVTFAKFQNLNTDTLVGRDASGSGDATEITVGGGIEFTGAGALRTTAFTGDVTKAAGGTALTIANDAVTYAKMQNVSAASRLLGRGDSGSGDPQEITLGSGLSMSGTTLNATGGGGTVTSITAGLGLTGGTITLSGTLAVDFAPGGTISATQAVRADDPRLSDARTPLAHVHAITDVVDLEAALLAAQTTMTKTARKATAGTITKGQIVYVVGSVGNHLTVELADADTESTSSKTIGVAMETITDLVDGDVITEGYLEGLSNLPTATFADGATLWLSQTAGGWTTTRPTQPAHGVFLGWVITASNGSSGRAYIKVMNGFELYELHDVLISSPTNGQVLTWNSTLGLWVNATPSGGGGGGLGETFETVAQNLKAYNYTLSRSGGAISSVTYDLGGGFSIVKTINRTGGVVSSIVLSGSTPSGITLTKTLTRNISNEVVSVSYS